MVVTSFPYIQMTGLKKELTYLLQIWCRAERQYLLYINQLCCRSNQFRRRHDSYNYIMNWSQETGAYEYRIESNIKRSIRWFVKICNLIQTVINFLQPAGLVTSQTHVLVRSKRHVRRTLKNSQTMHCNRFPKNISSLC